jgi:hypothetical protein
MAGKGGRIDRYEQCIHMYLNVKMIPQIVSRMGGGIKQSSGGSEFK